MPLVKQPLSGPDAPREKLFRVSTSRTLFFHDPIFQTAMNNPRRSHFFFFFNQSILFEKRFVLRKIFLVLASKKKFFLPIQFSMIEHCVIRIGGKYFWKVFVFAYFLFPSSFVPSIDRSEIGCEKKEKRARKGRIVMGTLRELPWRNAFSFGARGNSLTRSPDEAKRRTTKAAS